VFKNEFIDILILIITQACTNMSQELISKLTLRQEKIYEFFVCRVISNMDEDNAGLSLFLKDRLIKSILSYEEKELHNEDPILFFHELCLNLLIYPSFYDAAVFKGISNYYPHDDEQHEEIIKDFEQLFNKLVKQ
jgi:hypothetical protein